MSAWCFLSILVSVVDIIINRREGVDSLMLVTFLCVFASLGVASSFFVTWRAMDNAGLHFMSMVLNMKKHSPNMYKWVNAGFFFAILIAVGISTFVAGFWWLYERRIFTSEGEGMQAETAVGFFITWTGLFPSCIAAFTAFVGSAVISTSHFLECQCIKNRVKSSFGTEDDGAEGRPLPGGYVGSGQCIEDLSKAFMRICKTSETWTFVIFWMLLMSTCLIFIMSIAIVRERFSVAVYTPFIVALPALWVPAFAGGSVTARLIHIYIALANKQPMLVRVRRGQEKEAEAEGTINSTIHPDYDSEHHKLMDLCKHMEDIFALRIFGLAITSARISEIFAFYATVMSVIVQKASEIQAESEENDFLRCACDAAANATTTGT
jgi:hypothetical protein